MKSTSTAEAISAQLLDLLPQQSEPAAVHSVFRTSANLLYQGQLVTLLDDTRPLYPCAVRLGGSLPALTAGEPVLLCRERILFPRSGFTVTLDRAQVTSLSLLSPPSTLQQPHPVAAEALRETILTHGKPEGFAPLLTMLEASPSPLPDNPYVRYAADRVPALFAALRQRDAEAAGEAAYSIAGCGIGLTPSADDFLCGVMASVLASAIARGEQNKWLPITAAMAERAAPRTNLISAAFLRQAACGQLSSDVLTLIRTLYSSVLSLRLPSAAMNVIAFGETSGTDILTGIYFGQKIYPN